MSARVYKATEVGWTNSLTGDDEYCTIEFVIKNKGPHFITVLWERTQEECELRRISCDVAAELYENLDQMIEDCDVPGLEDGYPENSENSED